MGPNLKDVGGGVGDAVLMERDDSELNAGISFLQSKRILICDDSLTVRKIVSRGLPDQVARIFEARNGEEGFNILKSEPIDLIYLDNILPDYTAESFLEELLKDDRYADLPIILMSSKGEQIKQLSEFNLNVARTLTKPFDSQVALDAALEILASRASLKGGAISSYTPVNAVNSCYDLGFKVLRDELSEALSKVATHIPSLEAMRNEADAGPYYMRFLLNPNLESKIKSLNLQPVEEDSKGLSPALAGKLDGADLQNLAERLKTDKPTGLLVLRRDERTVKVYIHQGMVSTVTTESDTYYRDALGQYLDNTYLEALESILVRLRGKGARNDSALVLSREGQHKGVEEIFYDLGQALVAKILEDIPHFAFFEGPTPSELLLKYATSQPLLAYVANALRLESTNKNYLRSKENLATRYNKKYTRPPHFSLSSINREEKLVLEAFSKPRTRSEVGSQLDLEPFSVLKATRLLLKIGLIEKSRRGGARIAKGSDSKKFKVILASTDTEVIRMVCNCSQVDDLDLLISESPKSALKYAKDSAIDLLITDGLLHQKNEIQIVSKLREIHPSMSWILIEPATKQDFVSEILKRKPVAYIKRPLARSDVEGAINRAVGMRQEFATEREFTSDAVAVSEYERLNSLLCELRDKEVELQKRELDLHRNEEVFMQKCYQIEEERARVEIMREEVSQ